MKKATTAKCQAHRVGPFDECSRPSLFQKTRGKNDYHLCRIHLFIIGRAADKLRPRPKPKVQIIYRAANSDELFTQKARIAELENELWRTRLIADSQAEILRLQSEGAPVRKQDPDEMGNIYILRVGGCYKIGWTSNLKNRMRSYHPDTTLMCVYPGTRADEKKLHKKWAHYLRNGREWFMLAPEIDRHIEQTIKQHGEPEKVDFSAKIRSA